MRNVPAHAGMRPSSATPTSNGFFRARVRRTASSRSKTSSDDFIKAINERQETNGLYAPPSGSEGIFIRTVHFIVQRAEMTPAIGKRKVFVIGDAHRMVAQEGTEWAANAFLKLLEEPQPDTTVVLTTSEPAALLPTIRSRVVALRAGRLSDADVRAFLKDPIVAAALESYSLPKSLEERVRLANGAPGALLGASVAKDAMSQATALLAAAQGRKRRALPGRALARRVGSSRGLQRRPRRADVAPPRSRSRARRALVMRRAHVARRWPSAGWKTQSSAPPGTSIPS